MRDVNSSVSIISNDRGGGIGIRGTVLDEVTRSIEPDSAAPGEDVTVTIAFTTPEDLYYLWLRDHVPLGWDVTDMEQHERIKCNCNLEWVRRRLA